MSDVIKPSVDHTQPDRLGDAIRELANTMAENGTRRLQLHIVTDTHRAVYEIRHVMTMERGKPAGKRALSAGATLASASALRMQRAA